MEGIDKINAWLDQRLPDVADALVKRAKEYAPKDTGKMAESIASVYDQETHSVALGYSDVGNEHAFLGLFFEMGTPHMSPRPVLRRTLWDTPDILRGVFKK
jgi:HK97 gp10 family phage protein